ncbi:sensor histidine kinase [Flavobacterium sp. KACC 22761]|uniref:sensor histidine kinase n=1 Tax=Flavobacterium sp. KACC 22761 TaxID=3092665 RepID=UPI002A758FB9|nr:sensor histidine kinase [Flavobacterium sp. KACC 22761]WPO77826.1 sensor histidine kinase [Flavobacterium sp. KACC 22761]
MPSKRNDTIVRDLYLKAGAEYYFINELDKSYKVSATALKLSIKENDSSRIAKSLYFMGDCYENTQKDSAYFYYLKAQKIYQNIHDNNKLGRVHFNKAYVLFYDGNFVECEIEIAKALNYLKETDNVKLLFSCNTLMGNCLEKLFLYDEALKYHQKALRALKTMKEKGLETSDPLNDYSVASVVNICNLYEIKGEYSKIIKELSPLLTNELRAKNPNSYASVLTNLAHCKARNKEYKNIVPMFLESLKIYKSFNDPAGFIYTKTHLGEYYLTQKDTLKAIENIKEAHDSAVSIRNTNEVLTNLKLLSQIDKKKSLFYANRYITMSDSIEKVKTITSNKYARIEYETQSIENENRVLTRKNFYTLIFSFSLFIVLSIISLYIYLRYRNKELRFVKQQQNDSDEIFQLLSEQNEKINRAKEEEKNKIARELHDGIMNKVYSIRMNLGFFNAKADENAIEKRREYIFELQNVENEIRSISHDLSQESFLENSDFNTLLLNLVEKQNGVNDIEFHYIIDEEFKWDAVLNVYKINIYRIIQEGILNIHKYSEASEAIIKIEMIDDKTLKLSIKDNGKGFDIVAEKKGIGLANIKERINSLKGHFEIISKRGRGTQITILLDI